MAAFCLYIYNVGDFLFSRLFDENFVQLFFVQIFLLILMIFLSFCVKKFKNLQIVLNGIFYVSQLANCSVILYLVYISKSVFFTKTPYLELDIDMLVIYYGLTCLVFLDIIFNLLCVVYCKLTQNSLIFECFLFLLDFIVLFNVRLAVARNKSMITQPKIVLAIVLLINIIVFVYNIIIFVSKKTITEVEEDSSIELASEIKKSN